MQYLDTVSHKGEAALHKVFRETPSHLSGNAPLSGSSFFYLMRL